MPKKADVGVFFGADGKPYVRPSVVIVQQDNAKKASLVVRNYTNSMAVVVVPHESIPQTKTLKDKNDKAGCKQEITLDNFDVGIHSYHVYVGNEEAQGESSPKVIIDE